jgi:RimJ/RimL family protein N-acetyltransferase
MAGQPDGGSHGVGGGSNPVDGVRDDPTLLRFEYSNDPNRVVMVEGDYVVVHMKFLSRAWLEELWEQIQKHKSMFWEPTHAELENFVDIVLRPGHLFFEVYKFGYLTGFFYFTNVATLTDIQLHGIAFDRKLTDKIPVVRKMISWLFENFQIERVEVAVVTRFEATMRFVERIGFVKEGTRRKAVIYRGRWRDQAMYSVTREEACHF